MSGVAHARKKALDDWLEKHHAVFRWQEKMSDGVLLRAYVVNGALILVMDMGDHGWEIYVQASNKLSIDETLLATEKACGIGREG